MRGCILQRNVVTLLHCSAPKKKKKKNMDIGLRLPSFVSESDHACIFNTDTGQKKKKNEQNKNGPI